jgi:putative PIG3 family NAD(P)H quinone oxidoreductase
MVWPDNLNRGEAMKAVEITKPGGPEVLVLCERERPSPKAGEVLIRVKAAGINRPDVVQRKGLYPPPPGASDIPGLEVAGVVEKVASGVSGLSVGDEVCALVPGGGYAEYCIAPLETCLPIPKGFSFEQAAAIPETYFTVWSNLFDRAHLQSGETCLVHGGSSGIGSTAIQLAKAFDAKVLTTVGSAEKAKFCEKLGADLVINYRDSDFEALVLDHVKEGVNVVLDMVGGDYIAKNIQCLAPDGRHVSIAFLNGPNVSFNMLPVMLKRLVLTGSTLRPRDNVFKGAIARALFEKVWPLFEAGTLAPVLDTVVPMKDAAKAHHLMETSEHMGKIVLKIT